MIFHKDLDQYQYENITTLIRVWETYINIKRRFHKLVMARFLSLSLLTYIIRGIIYTATLTRLIIILTRLIIIKLQISHKAIGSGLTRCELLVDYCGKVCFLCKASNEFSYRFKIVSMLIAHSIFHTSLRVKYTNVFSMWVDEKSAFSPCLRILVHYHIKKHFYLTAACFHANRCDKWLLRFF